MRTTVKATYSLDETTVVALERLAVKLRVSKSEVLRRAIRHLARLDLAPGDAELAALDELQKRLGLTSETARSWENEVRAERRAAPRP